VVRLRLDYDGTVFVLRKLRTKTGGEGSRTPIGGTRSIDNQMVTKPKQENTRLQHAESGRFAPGKPMPAADLQSCGLRFI